MKKHDLVDGTQSQCQICGNKDLQLVVDLGTQPLADKLQRIKGKLSTQGGEKVITDVLNKLLSKKQCKFS